MDVLKKVFDHVKKETGREEIMESDMNHVNQVLSTN
jgi:predicted small metal-binding protein